MDKKTILVGGAWPYANNSLHIGHLAALLPGDVLARFFRQDGNEVIYVSGSDCHGTPITIRANKNNVTPLEIATHYHNEFVKNFKDLNFSYDKYGCTMDQDHKQVVSDFLKQIDLNDYLYTAYEDNYYCPTCQKIVVDREIVGECPTCHKEANGEQCDSCLSVFKVGELLNAKCKYCQSNVQVKSGKHLYFKLSKLTDLITQFIEKQSKQFNWRNTAISESLKYVKEGLKDRVVTRDLTWGIDVPFEGFEDKKIYVWFEAVLGYFSQAIAVAKQKGQDFLTLCKQDNFLSYYVHGKDNIVFHTIILPALLEAIDKNLNKPNAIISCEYVNLNDEKMSKSKGNLITVNNLLANFDVDSIRYFFIKNNPEKKDSSFSYLDFVECNNKILLGGYGNFANRNLSFLKKKFDGQIPELNLEDQILTDVKKWYEEIKESMYKGELKNCAELFYSYVQYSNAYFDKNKPWTLYENDKKEFDRVTSNCLFLIANLANISSSIMPNKSKILSDILGFSLDKFEVVYYTNKKIENDIIPMFSRCEIDKIDKQIYMADTFGQN